VIVAADNPWLVPRNCSNAWAKSLPSRTRRANGGPDQNFNDFEIILGKVRLHVTPPRAIHRF
jgi:hypothetical protein